MNRPGQVSFVPLVALANVDDGRRVAVDQLARVRRIDLVDRSLDLKQEIPVTRHLSPA